MKRVFDVKIEFLDGSCDYYHVATRDDMEARVRAIELARKLWKNAKSDPEEEVPGVDYCEIRHVCRLD